MSEVLQCARYWARHKLSECKANNRWHFSLRLWTDRLYLKPPCALSPRARWLITFLNVEADARHGGPVEDFASPVVDAEPMGKSAGEHGPPQAPHPAELNDEYLEMSAAQAEALPSEVCQACRTTVGDLCSFPFTYNGVTYYRCTTANNQGVAWCYDVRGSGNWGICNQECFAAAQRPTIRVYHGAMTFAARATGAIVTWTYVQAVHQLATIST
eukprot:g58158.t1